MCRSGRLAVRHDLFKALVDPICGVIAIVNQSASRWRVRIEGEAPDLARLDRELAGGDVVVGLDSQGAFLQGQDFEHCSTADEVRPVAEALITRLNGIAALGSGYRPVRFAGRIERDEFVWVYVSDAIRAVDVVLTVGGVVTQADGTAQVTTGMSPMVEALRSSQAHPVLAEVYRVLGSHQQPRWVEFYKAYELLRRECGGDQALAAQTGVAEKRIELLTMNSNHQLLTGDEARHASMPGVPPSNRRITLDEGRAILSELIRGFTWSLGDS